MVFIKLSRKRLPVTVNTVICDTAFNLDYAVYWSETKWRNAVKGGTNTAFWVAKLFGVKLVKGGTLHETLWFESILSPRERSIIRTDI